jgi:UDP-N-acetylglucosamine 2-epimerase (non-hydrolysing)
LVITHVVGARPNLMKAAPVIAALDRRGWHQRLVHTGQHYDAAMSELLFEQLKLPRPNVNLGTGSGTHAQQTAAVLIGIEQDLSTTRPALLIVYGDVNSTAAATIAAAKLQIPVAHVEAGVRSFDRSMPEEINRVITDRLATYLFAPSPFAVNNLRAEGVDENSIHEVGNVMVDSISNSLPLADPTRILDSLGLRADTQFVLATFHRPATVDDPEVLIRLLSAIAELAKGLPVIFPVHPRTRARIGDFRSPHGLHVTGPLSYLEFIGLQRLASLVITDSGGVQVETSYLGVACLTMRDTTEWPETVVAGSNALIGRDPERLVSAAKKSILAKAERRPYPTSWDGRASERIADVIGASIRRV